MAAMQHEDRDTTADRLREEIRNRSRDSPLRHPHATNRAVVIPWHDGIHSLERLPTCDAEPRQKSDTCLVLPRKQGYWKLQKQIGHLNLSASDQGPGKFIG